MTPEMMTQALTLLIKQEDDKKRAYIDPLNGDITAGVGHNLSARDIEDDIRMRWAKSDITEFYNNWNETFPWFKDLNEPRQIALISFAFQGWKHVLGFTKMISHLAKGEMLQAADELMDSDYGRKLTTRAKSLADILVSGVLHV